MVEVHREQLNLTQADYAARLGVSQPYLSLLESGRRPVTAKLRERLSAVFGADPTHLPLFLSEAELDDDALAHALGRLGYPGFAHLTQGPLLNPAVLVLECLRKANVDARVTQALPWLLARFKNLDSSWLATQAKLRNLQNRLGYLVVLALELGKNESLELLLAVLEPARLATEQTLCSDAMKPAERNWLRNQERPAQAVHWNLLTDLTASSLKSWGMNVHTS